MKKQEIINFLRGNIHYFDGIDISVFKILEEVETYELNLMSQASYLVTPLLKQIANYALVVAVIQKEELEQIEEILDDEKDLDNVLEFCEQCFEYINILRDENCLHPSIINSVNLVSACQSYTIILEIMSNLIKKLSDNFQDDLINFGCLVDERITNEHDELLELILDTIYNSKFFDSKQLLIYLYNYCIDCAKLTMLLTSNNILLVDNCVVNIAENKNVNSENDLKIGDSINHFATIMQKVDKYLDYCSDLEIIELLEKIKEGYNLYSGYRCDYLRNMYRESCILKKCKKM